MAEEDIEDPAAEAAWCKEQRFAVAEYLKRQGIVHGRIDEEPPFLVAPYVSLWGVCSSSNPGVLAWWVIIGDLPTDYVSADSVKDPRAALCCIGERWLEASACLQRGELHPRMSFGEPETWTELAPMLESRARTILEWAADDEVWGDAS